MCATNFDVRQYAMQKGVYLYEIAERVGVNDGNFSRRLRKELPEAEKTRIFQIIDSIAAAKTAAVAVH